MQQATSQALVWSYIKQWKLTTVCKARSQVENNGLGRRINLAKVQDSNADLIPASYIVQNLYSAVNTSGSTCPLATFTMCNPPFYADDKEMRDLEAAKAAPTHGLNLGAETEIITPGGEARFVNRLLQQSLILKTRIQWYTTLVGRHSTMTMLASNLREANILNWTAAPLQSGNVTRRWVVAWSFDDWRPRMSCVLPHYKEDGTGGAIVGAQLSVNNEAVVQGIDTSDVANLRAMIEDVLERAGLKWHRSLCENELVVIANGNVWGRVARRKRKRGEDVGSGREFSHAQPLMVARICLRDELMLRWMKGTDRGTFDSFVAFIADAVRGKNARRWTD